MWLPYNGNPNQIQVDQEKHLKHIVTKIEGDNELVAFNNNIIDNYSAESFLGNFKAHESPFLDNVVISQVENFLQIDASECKNFINKLVVNTLFWTLYFDGSKSNNGAGAGCILIIPEGEKTMLACRLQFECTNNTAEYKELVQGFYKQIGLNIKYL